MEPLFPIRIMYHEDGTEEQFDTMHEAVCTLEWFDSDDPEWNASVTDASGRAVRLKVNMFEVLTFELAASPPENLD